MNQSSVIVCLYPVISMLVDYVPRILITRFLKEINYVYNESNPLNDHKVHMEKVNRLVKEIRSKKLALKRK